MRNLYFFIIFVLAFSNSISFANDDIKNLKPESKKTLKKMILMTGKIEKNCEDNDPDICLGTSVDKSAQINVKSDEKKDTIVIESASLAKEANSDDSTTTKTMEDNSKAVVPKLQAQDEDLSTTADPGLVTADERSKIIHALTQECRDQKKAVSCKRLAVISKEMKKPRAAVQLYKLACDNGDALICRELATKLEKMGKKDLAAKYQEKACINGDQKSCVIKLPSSTETSATQPIQE